MPDPTEVERADVWKSGVLAATLTRASGGVEFAYRADYDGPPVATTLPRGRSSITVGGAIPAYFAGLLPEGRRLSALRRSVKTSADDELSLVLAVGTDPVGDVQVVPEGETPVRASPRLTVDHFEEASFADLFATEGMEVDPVALAGVQDKASLAMLNLPVSAAGRGYLLKLDPPEYPHLTANESFFLRHAHACRVEAVEARTVTDRDGRAGLVVTRFDRAVADGDVRTFAVEDGCQVLGLHPEAKYRRPAEEVLGRLAAVCAAPRPAALTLLRQVTYAYVTGNGDAHAKNFSVLGDAEGRLHPAPAYDLPSSQPYGDHTLAMRVGGANDGNLTGARFVALGVAIGLTDRAARRAVTETARGVEQWIEHLEELPYDAGVVRKLRRVVDHRRRMLLEH